jgi:hypothetical protein
VATSLRGPGEVAEDEAGPRLAAAYARLRELLGVPFVPTVYRRLGCHEPFLTAAVDRLALVLEGATADRFGAAARGRGAAAAEALGLEPLPAGGARAEALALVERYNAANPRGLLFALALAGDAAGDGPAVMRPPLPEPADDLPADVRACHGGVTVPGLWRELAASAPSLARAAWAQIRPLAGDERFASARRDVLRAAREAIAAAPAPPEPPAGERAAIDGILAGFIPTIAAMVVEIEILRRGLTAGAR